MKTPDGLAGNKLGLHLGDAGSPALVGEGGTSKRCHFSIVRACHSMGWGGWGEKGGGGGQNVRGEGLFSALNVRCVYTAALNMSAAGVNSTFAVYLGMCDVHTSGQEVLLGSYLLLSELLLPRPF